MSWNVQYAPATVLQYGYCDRRRTWLRASPGPPCRDCAPKVPVPYRSTRPLLFLIWPSAEAQWERKGWWGSVLPSFGTPVTTPCQSFAKHPGLRPTFHPLSPALLRFLFFRRINKLHLGFWFSFVQTIHQSISCNNRGI
jgi:hypothetical protein